MKLKTFAYVTNEIMGNYQLPMARSIRTSFHEKECNLITFEGRILDGRLPAEKEHNFVYKLIPNYLDGIILSSASLLCEANDSQKQSFVSRISGPPIVSIGEDIPGTTSVLIDNQSGTKEIVDHLVDIHGYKKIAYISGPPNSSDPAERLEAFLSHMKTKGLEVQDNWIIQGNLRPESGRFAMKKILEERMDIEAIIFANDDMAIAAINYLDEINSDFMDSHAIVGFDDVQNASLTSPPLTTVRQPFKEITDTAAELLTETSQLERTSTRVETKLVVRRSCGSKQISEPQMLEKLYHPTYKICENIQTYSFSQMTDQLTNILINYDIESCYIALFDNISSNRYTLSSNLPTYSNLVYAFSDGTLQDTTSGSRFLTRDILPKHIKLKEPYSILVKPLFFQNEHFGYIVFNVKNGLECEFETLRSCISSTIKFSLLMEERDSVNQKLTDALSLLSDYSEKLHRKSMMDMLTGIYNRRGFFERLEKYQRQRTAGQSYAIIYVDLDNLKVINDKLGHKTGDKAIHAMAKTDGKFVSRRRCCCQARW